MRCIAKNPGLPKGSSDLARCYGVYHGRHTRTVVTVSFLVFLTMNTSIRNILFHVTPSKYLPHPFFEVIPLINLRLFSIGHGRGLSTHFVQI